MYIFLDEITSVEDWNIELKILADSGITEKCTIVVAGSNPWKFKQKKERLPGRGVEGNEKMFFPLSFREFVLQLKEMPNMLAGENFDLIASLRQFYTEVKNFDTCNIEDRENTINSIRKILPYQKELQFLFRIYLLTGGFPESINSYLSNKYLAEKREEKIDDNVYERFVDVVRGDLAEMVRNDYILREFINIIIKKQCSRYSFRNIASSMFNEPDHKTINVYTELLKETLLVRFFYSFEFSKLNYRPSADKKIYFYDPFLYYSMNSWISGKPGYEISSEILLNDELVGSLVEGIIGHHIALTTEKLPMCEMITFLWFYYDKYREIDFLYRKGNDEFIGFEVKYQNSVSKKDMSIIDRVKEYYLISKDNVELELEKVSMIPAHLFLFVLQKSKGCI